MVPDRRRRGTAAHPDEPLLWKETTVKYLNLLLLPLLIAACNSATDANAPVCVPADAGIEGLTPDGDPVVAMFDDQEIKLSELDAEAKGQILKAMMNIDQARHRTLDTLLFDTLAEAEAAAAGMELEAWKAQEIDAKIEPVTEDEAREFFKENPPRGGRADFDQMKDRVTAYMERMRKSERQTELYAELKEKHGVRITLDPFRLEVSPDDDPSKGPADAVVTIVEFADFQCGFCGRSRPTTDEVLAAYPDTVRFVYRDYPIPKHPKAARMAEGANCSGDQGKYWEYYDILFDNPRKTTDEDLKAHAETLQLDTAAFNECLDSNKHADEVAKDMEDAAAVGVTGTPAFFINGRMLSGAQPFEKFAEIIDDELERAGVTQAAPAETDTAAQ